MPRETKILVFSSSTTGAVPPGLYKGEIAANLEDEVLFIGKGNGAGGTSNNWFTLTAGAVGGGGGLISGDYVRTVSGMTGDIRLNASNGITYNISGTSHNFTINIPSLSSRIPTPTDEVIVSAKDGLTAFKTSVGRILQTPYLQAPSTVANLASSQFMFFNAGSSAQEVSSFTTVKSTILDGAVTALNGCTGALTITGTANEIEVTGSCPQLVIGLPDVVTIQNLSVTNTLTAASFEGPLLGRVTTPVKNLDSITLTAGTPVYISGYVGAGAGGVLEVKAAQSASAAAMPAVGLLETTLAPNGQGHVVELGMLGSLNTNGFLAGQTLYIAPNGGLTATRPTDGGHLVQNIGKVANASAIQGQIIVLGPGRSNDVPNNIVVRGYIQMPNGQTATSLVTSVNGLSGAVTNVAQTNVAQTFTELQSFAAGFTASGATFSGNIVANNIVNSVNGSTGAVTFIATLNTEQQFTAKKDFASGLSATHVGITGGFTASSAMVAFTNASTPNLIGRNTGGRLRLSSTDTDAAVPTSQGMLIDGADGDIGGLGRVTLYADEVFVDSTTFQVTGNQTVSGTFRSSGVASFPAGLTATTLTVNGINITHGSSAISGLTCFSFLNIGSATGTDPFIRCVSVHSLVLDAHPSSGVVKVGFNTVEFNPATSTTNLGNNSDVWRTLFVRSVTGCTFSGNVDYNRNAESNTTLRNYAEPFAYQVRKEIATSMANNTYYVDLTYGNTFYLDLAADNSGTLGNYAAGSSKASIFVKGDGNAQFASTSGLTGATVSNVSGTIAVGQFIYAPGLTDTGVTATAYNAGTGALTLSKAAVATVSSQYAAFATANTVALGMVNSPVNNTTSTKSPARVHTFTLMVEGTAGGAITWNTTANTYGQIKWPSGTAPTLTATRGKYDVFSFLSYDYGVTWLAFNAGQNF